MRTVVQDKYFLRDLHREIDLYDRKLIHMLKHEVFATEALRDAAVRKLSTKRESLAATARTLVESGIEFHDNDLPRSFRPEGWVGAPHADTEASAEEVAAAAASLNANVAAPTSSAFGTEVAKLQRQALREEESPLATALGSWQDDLAAYKKKRQKTTLAAAI
jgi:hypothetical protein